MKIPKIIMQTWKTHDPPDIWKQTPEVSKKLNPDWEYHLLSDDDNREFMKKHFPQYLNLYDNLKYPIMRADMIRYAWLYVNGGLYYDLDQCPTKPFTKELEYMLSLQHEDHGLYLINSYNTRTVGSTLTNSFMGSVPGHKFWLQMLEELRSAVEKGTIPSFAKLDKHLYILHATGPGLLTKVAKMWKEKYNLLPIDRVCRYTLCDAKHYKEINEKNIEYYDPDSLFMILPGSSWVDDTCKILSDLYYCNPTKAAIITAVIVFILLCFIIMSYKLM